jgi:uncharacterized protein (DUF169 family)
MGKEDSKMTKVEEYNGYGVEMEKLLHLRTVPIAVKMLEKEKDIPKEAIRPKRDRGYHLAQCQAFALTRRNRETIAMLKEDSFCWAPLIAYGLVEAPEIFLEGNIFYPALVSTLEASKKVSKHSPFFEYGKYIGILSGPMSTASFEPDVVLIYSNTTQLRVMLMAIMYKKGDMVTSEFNPLDSCIYSVVPVIQKGDYRITLPDPGDFQRALATEDEIILSVPTDKVEGLVMGLRHLEEIEHGYLQFNMEMRPDFPRPDFYNMLFEKWGLDVENGISCGGIMWRKPKSS